MYLCIYVFKKITTKPIIYAQKMKRLYLFYKRCIEPAQSEVEVGLKKEFSKKHIET
jgi:hypothetical protein